MIKKRAGPYTKLLLIIALFLFVCICAYMFFSPPPTQPSADTIEEAIHASSFLKEAEIEHIAQTDNFAIAFCIDNERQQNQFLEKKEGKWSVITQHLQYHTKNSISKSAKQVPDSTFFIAHYSIGEKQLIYVIISNPFIQDIPMHDSVNTDFSTYMRKDDLVQYVFKTSYSIAEFEELPENYTITIGDQTIKIN